MIIGHHIAKTGGTSVMHHVLDTLGSGAYFAYGIHADIDRFFAGQPLFCEIPPAARQKLKLIFGHGVDQTLLADLDQDEPTLFTVLRDPFEHFVSKFNHRSAHLARRGQQLDAVGYMRAYRWNAITRGLVDHFSCFIEAETFAPEHIPFVLSQFRHLAITERLEEQTEPLFDQLGLPALDKRVRVTQAHAPLQGVTQEAVEQRVPMDKKIVQYLRAAKDDRRTNTPIEFRPDRLRASIQRLRDLQSGIDPVMQAYSKLKDRLIGQNLIEAARLDLALAPRQGPQFDMIAAVPDDSHGDSHGQSPVQQAVALTACGRVYRRHKRGDKATEAFAAAVALNPDYTDARIALAHALFHAGEKQAAKHHTDLILESRPNHAGAQRLRLKLTD